MFHGQNFSTLRKSITTGPPQQLLFNLGSNTRSTTQAPTLSHLSHIYINRFGTLEPSESGTL
jgi:hypothetical protein